MYYRKFEEAMKLCTIENMLHTHCYPPDRHIKYIIISYAFLFSKVFDTIFHDYHGKSDINSWGSKTNKNIITNSKTCKYNIIREQYDLTFSTIIYHLQTFRSHISLT